MKSYVTPMLSFESFELSSNVGSSCEYKTNHALNSCTYSLVGGRNVFVSAATSCHDITALGGEYGTVCYQVPNDQSNLFTS